MALASGSRLGAYEILTLLGSGGMGEVYRAHDTRLGRDVAIKVLPSDVATDPDRLARFEREAQVLAALNYPNIAQIYGVDDSGGVPALVMELVDGPTLADRIAKGPIPLEEALPIAKQIAEALEAAHEHGIIHRDLKPANIKVRPDGAVKVLDFGLAKAFDPVASVPGNATMSPTLSIHATQAGIILGTAAYMAPEQARGRTVDKRADMWAFGCVLYEMLTGRRAFQGDTTLETIAALLDRQPDWHAVPPATPGHVRDLARRCLQKEPRLRLQAIGDARIVLEEVIAGAPDPARDAQFDGGPQAASAPARFRVVPWAIAALLAGALVFVSFGRKSTPIPGAVARLSVTLPVDERLSLQISAEPILALSPDGSLLAYAAIRGGVPQLYLRPLDRLEDKALPGTENAKNPFFSPDGQWLGFFANGKLKKISVNGGAPLALADAPGERGAVWSSLGTIIFAPRGQSELQWIPDGGGAPQPLTHLLRTDASHRWPALLTDGKTLLYSGGPGVGPSATAEIVVQQPPAERKRLIAGGTDVRYAPTGHLIFAQAGTLMAVPFNPQRLELTGKAVPMESDVMQSTITGAAQYAFSQNGSLAYVAGGIHMDARKMVIVSRSGMEQPVLAPRRVYFGPRLSPDGRRVVMEIPELEENAWLYDLSKQTLSRLTVEGNVNLRPVWSADGRRVAFLSNKDGAMAIYWQLADGGGLERLSDGQNLLFPYSFSADGQLLAMVGSNPFDLEILRLSDHRVTPFLQPRFRAAMPQFSPDGRWLAYASDTTGRAEVYVQPYPEPGKTVQISRDGGNEPVWTHNGRELVYRDGDKMMAVDIATEPVLSPGEPHLLFRGTYTTQSFPSNAPDFDVSFDGQHFLMTKGEDPPSVTQINIVINWFEELKQKAPAGNK